MRPIEHVTNMYKQLYSLLVYTTNTIGFSVVRVARPEHGHKPCPTVAQEAIPTLIPPGISITGYTRYKFQDSEKDKIKPSLQSICQKIDRIAMPEREEDLVIRYLSSHKGPMKTDLCKPCTS